MPGRFEGRRVLITGASAGIGRASAVAFARQGARVLAVARSEDRLRSLSEQLGGPPVIVAIAADVTDAASMEALAARVLSEGGPPDVIVANAGIGLDARFEDTTDESLRAVFEVNVFGVFRTLRPFLPGMVRRGSGRIVLVSSIVGKRGVPHYAAYSASKFALHGIAGALRPELLGSGVTVGIVCPASTDSEFHERKLHEGPPQKRVRAGSHSADSVARAIVDMAGSHRRERVLTVEGKALAWADALVPGLLDRLLARMLVRRD